MNETFLNNFFPNTKWVDGKRRRAEAGSEMVVIIRVERRRSRDKNTWFLIGSYFMFSDRFIKVTVFDRIFAPPSNKHRGPIKFPHR